MITRKVCILGAFAVGKTSLVRRFVHSIFSDKYLVTIGVKIDKKVVPVEGSEVTLVLWDVQGEADYAPITDSYLRGAAGHILVIDGTRPETLEAAERLRARLVADHPDTTGVLLLNKCDLTDEWRIGPAREAELAAGGWPVFKTSAKSGQGVEEGFVALVRQLSKK